MPRTVAPIVALWIGLTALAGPATHAQTEPISDFDRDRAAILAMAGEFAVDFTFRETVAVEPGYELREPYQADASEFVEVVEDTGNRIVLQHILVATDDDGAQHVIKHWRQDWTYEDTRLTLFRGDRIFENVDLSADQVAGKWSQHVSQVDDSPRYEALGKWVHEAGRSSWASDETWRPLPRREYSKRSDYDVLVAKNRHTITPAGWVHEQDNYKLALNGAGDPKYVLAHEVGVNTYTRVEDADFSDGRSYWRDTQAYWKDVRDMWSAALSEPGRRQVATQVENKAVYAHLFGVATDIREQGSYEAEHREKAEQVIRASVSAVTKADS